ncbi:MAG: bifunctional folylpolyglutamate synthase/dihydrofolate synthase [Myxococcales bacterium]|nr:bifunctional folylpolyglutamate synthase/dihydrofolate synthase [Myxococcales bacterium]
MNTGVFMDSPGERPPAEGGEAYRALVERLYALSRFGVKMGLERIEALLCDLGSPERAFRAVHVAGSNGKGSTSAFLASIWADAGHRVGLYTSPHLISLTERVQVLAGPGRSGEPVRPERLVEAVAAVEAVRPGLVDTAGEPLGLTFFEVITAAGLWALAREGVDVAVIEAGLGARLDATRAVEAEVAVLTDLSLVHTAILGDTIEEIAADEGAVVRPGRPLVAADGPAGAMRVVEALARAVDAPLFRIGRELFAEPVGPQRYRLHLSDRVLEDAQLSLRGPHQGRNALLAAEAAVLAEPELPDHVLRSGLARAQWPGRMEILERGGVRYLLDGAQNPHAARALARALQDEPFVGPRHFVFGALGDKDAAAMLEALTPLAASVTVTRPASPRARDPRDVARGVDRRGGIPVEAVDAIPDALARAAERALGDGGWVVVCGSLYLVGDARALLIA